MQTTGNERKQEDIRNHVKEDLKALHLSTIRERFEHVTHQAVQESFG